jgi:hypothetical protein
VTQLSEIDATVVTRGTRTIAVVLPSMRSFRKVAVWDNSKFPNLKIFGRFAAVASMTDSPLVYTQDDDVVVDDGGFEALLGAWRPGRIALNFPKGNRRNYEGVHGNIALIGFGAIFEPRLVGKAFSRYLDKFPMDELFLSQCDRVFTALNDWTAVDVPKRDMPWAGDSQSMESDPNNGNLLTEIKRRIAQL